MNSFLSWGRHPRVELHKAVALNWLSDVSQNSNMFSDSQSCLPYGQGRSYGDSCLNDKGNLIVTQGLRRFLSFDSDTGVLRAESGVTLEQIINLCLPRGWFLPVSPGTKFVSLGGAIANDIHGKNHHRGGTFGRHVRQFELLRSDGSRLLCSPSENREYFEATIAGLGLTGLILWAEIQLKPVANAYIDMQSIKFENLDQFFQISQDSDKDFEYTVAWLDCVSTGKYFGRGIFMRGNHSQKSAGAFPPFKAPSQLLNVPLDLPNFLLNPLTIQAFNTLYYHKQFAKFVEKTEHYNPFFYPLDALGGWNRIYGKRGFCQFQCVVPGDNNNQAMKSILRTIIDSQRGSFLAVLKEFGDLASPGMLSFPRKGATLCLDFPYDGEPTDKLFADLDQLVAEAGGAIYPAKDCCMAAKNFKQYFPRWVEFSAYIDPRFSSSFWRRVNVDQA